MRYYVLRKFNPELVKGELDALVRADCVHRLRNEFGIVNVV